MLGSQVADFEPLAQEQPLPVLQGCFFISASTGAGHAQALILTGLVTISQNVSWHCRCTEVLGMPAVRAGAAHMRPLAATREGRRMSVSEQLPPVAAAITIPRCGWMPSSRYVQGASRSEVPISSRVFKDY